MARFAAELQAMGVVHQPIADRIGEGLVADEGVPVPRLDLLVTMVELTS